MPHSYATKIAPITSYGVRFNECIESLTRSVDNRAWLPHRCAPLRAPLRQTTLDDSQRLSKAKQSEELSAHCIAPHGVHPVHRCSQTSGQILLVIDTVSSGRAGQVKSGPEEIVHTNLSQITNQIIMPMKSRIKVKVNQRTRGISGKYWSVRYKRNRSSGFNSKQMTSLSKSNSIDRTVNSFVNTSATQPLTYVCSLSPSIRFAQ